MLEILRPASITMSDEFARVASLARRPVIDDAYVEVVSQALRLRPHNDRGEPNLLRHAQVAALRELCEVGGLGAPMPVGSGKTLVTLLAAMVITCARPVLLIPASRRQSTIRAFAELRRDWRVRLPVLLNYETLSHRRHADDLIKLNPDLLILDEAHNARNTDSSVSRRIDRAIRTLRPIVATLSGTWRTHRLMDSHTLSTWSLGARSPLPISRTEAERWGDSVDKSVSTLNRIDPGPLGTLPGGYSQWIMDSRGIVPGTPGTDCTASLEISLWQPETPPELLELIQRVEASSMRPDGELLGEWDLPECLSTLALGFYDVWDPLPPDWWLRPRRAWNAYVRVVRDEHLPQYDSEAQIVHALDSLGTARGSGYRHHYDHVPPPAAFEGKQLLDGWRQVRPLFTPNPVPVWLDQRIANQAAAWAKKHRGIVWVRSRAIGKVLQRDHGIPYFGEASDPEHDATPGKPMVCSIQAHGEGANLQYGWKSSLVLQLPGKADRWEQLLGRTHRMGQTADLVRADLIASIPYHRNILQRVRAQGIITQHETNHPHKLAIASWNQEP